MVEKQKDWITPVALAGGGVMLAYGAYKFFSKDEEESSGEATIGEITADPYSPNYDGDIVIITVPVTNNTDEPINATVSITIRRGNVNGTVTGEHSQNVIISVDSTVDVEFEHACLDIGGDATRDIAPAQVRDANGNLLASKNAANKFRVEGAGGLELLEMPRAVPYEGYYDGDVVELHVPVLNNSTIPRNVEVIIYITQGGSPHNPIPNSTHSKEITIGAGESLDVVFQHTCSAVEGDATRDVKMELQVEGVLVTERVTSNIFRVDTVGSVELQDMPKAVPYEGYYDGDIVELHVPIVNNSDSPKDIQVTIAIEQGGSPHTTIPNNTHTQEVTIGAYESLDMVFQHTCSAVEGDATRDVDIVLYYAGFEIAHKLESNIYRVETVIDYSFSVGNVTVTPQEGLPGTVFQIEFDVTNNSSIQAEGIIEVLIRQGEWIGTGIVLDTKTLPFIMNPGQTGHVTAYHTGQKTYTGDDQENERDVDINIYVGGELVFDIDADQRNFFRILEPMTNPVLDCDASVMLNGVLNFSFSDFPPYTSIHVGVVNWGYQTVTSDSNGSGSGSTALVGVPAGLYTLEAFPMNNPANRATATFQIVTGPPLEPDWDTFPNDGNPYYYIIFTDESAGWFDSATGWYLIINEYDSILKYFGPYTTIP